MVRYNTDKYKYYIDQQEFERKINSARSLEHPQSGGYKTKTGHSCILSHDYFYQLLDCPMINFGTH